MMQPCSSAQASHCTQRPCACEARGRLARLRPELQDTFGALYDAVQHESETGEGREGRHEAGHTDRGLS